MDSRPDSRRISLVRSVTFVVLFAVAIPWYWDWFGLPPDSQVWGMPSWFVVAVLGSFAISVAAAWCLRRPWIDETIAAEEEPKP